MSTCRHLTDDQLIAELNRLEVHFLNQGEIARLQLPLTAAELLAGLACSANARVRLAIIPLLLHHPSVAYDVMQAVEALEGSDKNTLMLFYMAALFLQAKYRKQLDALIGTSEPLPDLFAASLQLIFTSDLDMALQMLGERHRSLTGLKANWVGTYEHTAERMIKRLENEARWHKQTV
jgi:hypothetical protein